MKTPVYLDHQATTPLDPRVLEVWQRTAREHFGNPASAGHAYGWAANKVLDLARQKVADLVGATPDEILFTSGATEANNLALLGVARAYAGGGRDGLVSSNLEHPAVRQPLNHLAGAEGCRLAIVEANAAGLVEPARAAEVIDDRTLLVSLIAAQNEIGTLQPIAEVGALCHRAGAFLHVDAAQAAGRMDLDVERDQIDLMSLSGHKMYGPKGVGALYVRRRDPRVKLAPLMYGGGQERDLRPGTPNVPAIAAFGEACRLAGAERETENSRLAELRERLWQTLRAGLSDVQLNGDPVLRLAGNLNLSFGGVPSGRLLGALSGLAVSTGSACSSGDGQPSPVLAALGVEPALAAASLRIGLGRFTTVEEVDFAGAKIVAAVTSLRS
ncbi:MAG: cysteine desulfurase family protein [Candidatus Krumholzibacteria bacterium]|nr:cysteine desulfurase family protein [Candidatus Krumholzibacteria bacterium]